MTRLSRHCYLQVDPHLKFRQWPLTRGAQRCPTEPRSFRLSQRCYDISLTMSGSDHFSEEKRGSYFIFFECFVPGVYKRRIIPHLCLRHLLVLPHLGTGPLHALRMRMSKILLMFPSCALKVVSLAYALSGASSAKVCARRKSSKAVAKAFYSIRTCQLCRPKRPTRSAKVLW